MIKRILRRLNSHKKVYILLELQLMIGFFLLLLFLTAYVNVKTKYMKLEEEGKIQDYTITMEIDKDIYDIYDVMSFRTNINLNEPVIMNENTNYPIDLSQIPYMEEAYDCAIHVVQEKNIWISEMDESEKDSKSTTILYSTDIENVVMTKEFYHTVTIERDKIIIPRDFPYEVKDGYLYHRDESVKIEIVDSMDYVACLPMRYYHDYFTYENLYYYKIKVKAESTSSSDMIQKVAELASYLGEQNSTYTYTLSNEFYDFASLINVTKNESYIISIIAIFMLIVIIIGMGCILIMMMDKRKKELAVCIAVGSSKLQVILEILFEVAVIILSSFIIGVIGCTILTTIGCNMAGVYITMDTRVTMALLGISIVLTGLVTLPSAYRVYRFMPMEILKCE